MINDLPEPFNKYLVTDETDSQAKKQNDDKKRPSGAAPIPLIDIVFMMLILTMIE